MLFNSFQYVFFFVIVASVFFALPMPWRNRWLLAASLLFYMSWMPAFVLLILLTTTIDYFSARRIFELTETRRRRAWLVLSLGSNFGVLFLFKYYDFAARSSALVAQAVGLQVTPHLAHLVLPIGISFYTFEAVSYTVDVYRGAYPAERNYWRLLLFITFFPKLIAGPIERAGHLIPQFRERRSIEYERFRDGLAQILWGFFKKLVIADRLALYVDAVYGNVAAHSGSTLLVATLCFAFQIYADFSAYSDIALGSARILGIELLRNFRRPYFAGSITDFWGRWHISLSTWFRDYLYIPLGGNRRGSSRTSLNVLTVFLVSGAWHGANWTFVLWGACHGLLVLGQQTYARVVRPKFPAVVPVVAWLGQPLTFASVCLAWVFFRASSVQDALYVYRAIATDLDPARFYYVRHLAYGLGGVALLLVGEALAEAGFYPRLWAPRLKAVRWVAYLATLMLIVLAGVVNGGQFIYFQF